MPTRLSSLGRSELDGPGRAMWDAIVSTRGAGAVGPEGALLGPFNPWLHAPAAGAPLSEVGAALRFGSSLNQRLVELGTLAVVAHWRAEYGWWAHSRLALELGVPAAAITAIGGNREPELASEHEAAVYAVARQLLCFGHVGQRAYETARRLLGDRELVELVLVCGYYTAVSFTLNAFESSVPAGGASMWNRAAQPDRIP